MSGTNNKLEESLQIFLENRISSDKQMLALDALSNLARQFSNNPDFNNILDMFLLTTLGQFTAANAFTLFIKSKLPVSHKSYFATGLLANNDLLKSLDLSLEHKQYFYENRKPQKVEDMQVPSQLANFKFILSECGVRLIAPMLNNNNLIGLVGLGKKVNKRPFDETDIEILSTIMNTVTPFVANTFLFSEMTELGNWYLSILNNVKQGVFVFNKHGILKKINDAGFEIIRTFKPTIENSSALQQAPAELIFPNSIYTGWLKIFKNDSQANRSCLYENLKAQDSKTERIFNVSTSSIQDELTMEHDLILTLDDITDQKESEQRLFNLEKLADKGMMVASITHELNNFLGLMVGGVELAQLALEKNNGKKANETLGKVSVAVEQMKRFTTGLTDIAKTKIVKKSEDLNRIVSNVLSFVSVQTKFSNISIITNLDNQAPHIILDSDQISQVLLNFLNNAADSIKGANNHIGVIKVNTKYDSDFVRMIISDNGLGIDPANKEKMFKFHFTTKTDGHGFGLVTCGKILKNHNAKIEIISEPGKGAEFNIAFPLDASSL